VIGPTQAASPSLSTGQPRSCFRPLASSLVAAFAEKAAKELGVLHESDIARARKRALKAKLRARFAAASPTSAAATSPDFVGASSLPVAAVSSQSSSSTAQVPSLAAVPPMANDTKVVLSAPPTAGAHPTITLFDELTSQRLEAHIDGGSFVCTLSKSFVVSHGIAMHLRPADSPIPAELPLADKSSTLKVLGLANLRLEIPNTVFVVEAVAAVVESQFCGFLLGRNVMDCVNEAYGRPFVWTTSGSPCAPSTVAALEEYLAAADGVPVSASSATRVGVAQLRKITRESASRGASRAQFWIPERLLYDGDQRVRKLQGLVSPGAPNGLSRSGAAVVNAEIDWSESGGYRDSRLGPIRRATLVVPYVASIRPHQQRVLVAEGQRMGRFYIGSVAVDTSSSGASSADALKIAMERAKQSPYLYHADGSPTAEAPLAEATIKEFQHTSDLPDAAKLRSPPFPIRLTRSSRPTTRRNYPMTADEVDFAEKQIRDWLANGTIEPSESAWAHPIVIAYHPRTGKPRFCVDYRSLNAITVPDAYLMPLIQDIMESARGSKVFSKLDLAQGFGQLEVEKESRQYTAFHGPRGELYQHVGAPFGLRNVPAFFQRIMDRVLGSMKWRCAAIYIDDVIVFSKTVEEHHVHLAELAQRFKAANVWIKSAKCVFYAKEVEFLGYIFNGATIRVVPERVKAVLEVAIPRNREELRNFMGLLNQFHHNIPSYATLVGPLEIMKHPNSSIPFDLSKGSPGWEAFHRLRAALVQMPSLAVPNMRAPFHAYSDASKAGMSFVLCQWQDGVEQVIAFYSKAFTGSQVRWSFPVKEAFTVGHHVTGKVRRFLASTPSSGAPHKIYADSVAAQALLSPGLKSPALLRQAVLMQEMPIELCPVSGAKNKAHFGTHPPFITPDPALASLAQENPNLIHPGFLKAKLQLEAEAPQQPLSEAAPPAVGTSAGPPTNGVVAPVPAPSTLPRPAEDLLLAQRADPELRTWARYIRAGRPMEPRRQGNAGERARNRALSLRTRGVVLSEAGLLMRVTSLRGKVTVQAVIPKSLQQELLEEAHTDARKGLHSGKDGLRMFEALSVGAWWRTMRADCLRYECAICQRQKRPSEAPSGLLHSTPAGRPGQVLSMDLVPMPKAQGYNGFAIMVDKFSNAMSVALYEPKKPTAQQALALYDTCRNPLFVDVETVVVDSDSVLASKEFEQGIKARGSSLKVAFAGHQQANFAERKVKDAKNVVRTTLDGLPIEAWPTVVKDIPQHFNSVFLPAKGASVYEILTGWQPNGLIPYAVSADSAVQGHVFDRRQQLWDRVSQAMEKANQQQERQYNRKRKDRRFREGDVVLVRKLREDKQDGNFNLSSPMDQMPWVVEAVLSEVSLLLRSLEKKSKYQEVHVSRVYPAISEQDLRTSKDEYVVERILQHRRFGRHRQLQYLVQWSGFRDKRRNSWVPRSELVDGAADILRRYERIFSVNADA